MYEIYLHTNRINGKLYVGQTAKNMMTRWKRHITRAKATFKNNYFHNALLKYGFDVWDHLLLETVKTREEADIAEKKWIAHYKSNQKELGYNSTAGGSSASETFTPEVRKKISESVKKIMNDPVRKAKQIEVVRLYMKENGNPFAGKKHSEESLKKISERVKAYHVHHDNPFKGKTHDDETRARMSDAAKKRCADPNWKPPFVLYGIKDETRRKMSDARKGKHTGTITKEMILEMCRGSKTQKELADKLNCTAANISFLIRSFNIIDEVQSILKNRTPTKEEILQTSLQCRFQRDLAKIFDCTGSSIGQLLKKYDIVEEVKAVLNVNKGKVEKYV